jgi:hypothetical protein
MREGLTRATRGRSRRRSGGRRILALFAIACMPASISGAEAAEEGRPFLSALSPELAARIDELPAFLRDAQFTLHLRTFYQNVETKPGKHEEAWAGGG